MSAGVVKVESMTAKNQEMDVSGFLNKLVVNLVGQGWRLLLVLMGR